MSHSYANNYIHAVYSTKDRRSCIAPELEKRLYPFVATVAQEHHLALLSAARMPDHRHLLFLLPVNVSLASAMNTFKANSSRLLREVLDFRWQNGYGAFSVSHSQIEQVSAYIQNQREHHKKMTFEEEFLLLLKKSGVPCDPKYVFG